MGSMRVMGQPGDTKIVWDPSNAAEVANAKRTYEEMCVNPPLRERFRAYRVADKGKKGEEITKFDPNAEKIIIVPPMAGG